MQSLQKGTLLTKRTVHANTAEQANAHSAHKACNLTAVLSRILVKHIDLTMAPYENGAKLCFSKTVRPGFMPGYKKRDQSVDHRAISKRDIVVLRPTGDRRCP